ncbi:MULTISPECIES: hypothetical protein [Streptacidiphilus]|uniref:Uncharacterized protein n=1 Tax=Streptacidiphilus cavernicola TaxID=3342716 RepID=A0ABV6UWQ3_9ACTN|nr:hypothetical protein [Streptacidiphilus jeojiense]
MSDNTRTEYLRWFAPTLAMVAAALESAIPGSRARLLAAPPAPESVAALLPLAKLRTEAARRPGICTELEAYRRRCAVEAVDHLMKAVAHAQSGRTQRAHGLLEQARRQAWRAAD